MEANKLWFVMDHEYSSIVSCSITAFTLGVGTSFCLALGGDVSPEPRFGFPIFVFEAECG